MKYQLLTASVARPCIQVGNNNQFFFLDSPDFAAHVCGELNRLESQVTELQAALLESHNINDELRRDDADLQAQIDAKCRAIGQRDKLLTVLKASQDVLAEYTEPSSRLKPKSALTGLLGVLGHVDLVVLVSELDDERSKGHKATSTQVPGWATHEFRDHSGPQLGRLTLDGYYINSYTEAEATQVWTSNNIVAGSVRVLPHQARKVPSVEEPFTLDADTVYLDGDAVLSFLNARILDTTLTDFGELVVQQALATIKREQEPGGLLDHVVDNTINHFVLASPVKKRELRALREAIEELGLQSIPTRNLKSLLDKLS